MKANRPTKPALRSILGAGFFVFALSTGSVASADAVEPLDPMAAQICGGSPHHPNCPGNTLLSGCCALGSVTLVGVGFAVRSMRKGHGENPT